MKTNKQQSKKKQNNYAFIDSQNVYLSVKNQRWKLDWKRFRVYLKDKYGVAEAFMFIGYMPGNEALYTYLQQAGYTVIFKPTLVYKRNGKEVVKGNVDAELVLHAMIEYNNYDKAVMVTGDGDFHCLVEYLLDQGKLGRLLVPNRRKYSSLLWKFKEKMDFLNQLKQKVGEKPKKRQ